MKTNLYAGIMVGALLAGPAAAVTKCVALDSTATCTKNRLYMSRADWSATCITGGISTQIWGISFCSNKSGDSQYATSSTLSASDTANENVYCWCKMVSPAVSSWVFDRNMGDVCNDACLSECVENTVRLPAFRSALFSGLSD